MSTHVAQQGINLIDVIGYGSDREQFMVNGKDGAGTQEVLQRLINGEGAITSADCSIVTLVGWQLKQRALDIRMELAVNAELSRAYQQAEPVWNEGLHSIRFTVPRSQAAKAVDNAHRLFVER